MNRNTLVSLCYGCAALNSFSLLKYLFGFYRRNISYGWAFDLAFGSECFLNLVSDYLLLATYKDFPRPSSLWGRDSQVLLGFIVWNSAGVGICYVVSLVLAVHFANTVDLKEAMQEIREQNVDEADFRRQMMMTTISVFTMMAFVKGAILFNVYQFYKKADAYGSVEEAPTSFYFPADPNAPVPFLPPEPKGHKKASSSVAVPGVARCGLRGAPDAAAMTSSRRPTIAPPVPPMRRPSGQPYEVAVLRTPFMVLHLPPAEIPTGPQGAHLQQPFLATQSKPPAPQAADKEAR